MRSANKAVLALPRRAHSYVHGALHSPNVNENNEVQVVQGLPVSLYTRIRAPARTHKGVTGKTCTTCTSLFLRGHFQRLQRRRGCKASKPSVPLSRTLERDVTQLAVLCCVVLALRSITFNFPTRHYCQITIANSHTSFALLMSFSFESCFKSFRVPINSFATVAHLDQLSHSLLMVDGATD